MRKRFVLLVSILFSLSSLMASADVQQPQKAETIQQEEVDLNVFQNLEVLKLAVVELSKDTPKEIDKYTTLIDVTSKDLTLIYIYEINTGGKSDETVRKEDHQRMRDAVTTGTCRSSKRFLKSGISLSYLYNSAVSKEKLFQFDISQKDCSEF